MGIESYLIVSALSGVVAQRLVKTICKDCADTREATPVEKELFERRNQTIDTITFGRGCDVCRHTGYRGRMAIHELIVITDSRDKAADDESGVHQEIQTPYQARCPLSGRRWLDKSEGRQDDIGRSVAGCFDQ